ncbi:MAG: type IV pilus secretin PilQ [Elusimicrobia bacterium]|nr:type IV pilus secretin PilQ [Elusimicrobiota bacterium]
MKKILVFVLSFLFSVPQPILLAAAENVTIEGITVSPDSVRIKTDGSDSPYKIYQSELPHKLVIDFPGARVKTIQDLPASGKIIKRARTGQFSKNPDIARVVIELSAKTAYDIARKAGDIIVSFRSAMPTAIKTQQPESAVKDSPSENIPVIAPDAASPSGYQALKSELPQPKPASSSSYRSPSRSIMDSLPKSLISFDYNEADIKEVLNMMASRAGLNVIYGDDVSGTLTISLKNVPFDEAFRTILNVKGLAAQQVGENILRIATPKTFSSEQKNAMLQTRIFFLNYTKASEIKTQIESVASAEGRTASKCNVDETNNALIITDTPLGLESSSRLIKNLDRMPKQVLIEAKLVEVALDSDFHLGIQWSASGNSNGNYIGANDINSAIGPTTQFGGQKSIIPNYSAGSINGTQGNLSASAGGTGVELPANVIYGAFRLGRVTSNFMFDSVISAAAKKGKAKVLSDPKVATLNNKEANINITTQIPYTTTETTGSTPPVLTTKVVYLTTGIVLKVTPTITSDGKIAMRVNPSVSQPSPTITPVAGGAPGIDTRSADTNVIVQDGETIVIGGLIHDTQSDYVFKVPLLGDIPILGYLFRKKSVTRSRMELLIFVTPKIIEA